MSNCYICTRELNETNRSSEHVLLNAIGGMLKSDDLLCKVCNSVIGNTADAELSNQFALLAAHLQVRRDRGPIPPIKGGKTKSGEEVVLFDGDTPRLKNPKFEISEIDNDKLEINIVARNENELRSMLTGVRKKFPAFDVEAAMASPEIVRMSSREVIHYNQTFGGPLAFKSIAKTAVNFYLLNKGDKREIVHLLDYITGKMELDIVKHYHPKKPIYKKDAGEVIHLLHVVGDKHRKLLYCFVEFFSTHSFLVILSENYSGKNVAHTYAYNLLTHQKVKKDVTLKISEPIDKIPTKFSDFEIVKSKMDRFMEIASKIHTDKYINQMTGNAVRDIFEKKYGHERVITEQMIEELSTRVTNDFVKFVYGSQR